MGLPKFGKKMFANAVGVLMAGAAIIVPAHAEEQTIEPTSTSAAAVDVGTQASANVLRASDQRRGIGIAIIHGPNPRIGDGNPDAFGAQLASYANNRSDDPNNPPVVIETALDPNMAPGSVVFSFAVFGRTVRDTATFQRYVNLDGLESTLNYTIDSYDYAIGVGPMPDHPFDRRAALDL